MPAKHRGADSRNDAASSRTKSASPPQISLSESSNGSERPSGPGRPRSRASKAARSSACADRLGQVAVHAGRQAALAVAFHGVGRHGDDRDVAAGRRPPVRGWPRPPRSRPSRASARPSAPRRSGRPRAPRAPGGRRAATTTECPSLEHADGHLLVDRVVLGQQDPQPRRPRVGRPASRPRRCAADRVASRPVERRGPSSGHRTAPTAGRAWSGRRRSPGPAAHGGSSARPAGGQHQQRGRGDLRLGPDPLGQAEARPSRASCRRAARRRTAPPRRGGAAQRLAGPPGRRRRPRAARPSCAGPPRGCGGWWRCRRRPGRAGRPAAAGSRARAAPGGLGLIARSWP